MARDDFLKATIEVLAKRVGNRCSNPDCRCPTSGPHTSPGKAVIVGVAAHITAASPGGPRFDGSLSRKQRRGITNGIWLCETCAKLVDSDCARFPVEILREWKERAEEARRCEIEKTCFGETDPNGTLDPIRSRLVDELQCTHVQIVELFEEVFSLLEDAHDSSGVFHLVKRVDPGTLVAEKVRSLLERIVQVGHSFLSCQIHFVATVDDIVSLNGLTAPSMHTWVFDFVRESVLGNGVPRGIYGASYTGWRESMRQAQFRAVIGRAASDKGAFLITWPRETEVSSPLKKSR